MRGPEHKPTVKLIHENGIITTVKRALRAAGADQEYTNKYIQESMSGDRKRLLITAQRYVYIT